MPVAVLVRGQAAGLLRPGMTRQVAGRLRRALASLGRRRSSASCSTIFAERAGQWQNDYTVDFKMAYNHYFAKGGKKA